MKTKFIKAGLVFIALTTFSISTQAQTYSPVTTPRGSIVAAWITDEMSIFDRIYYDSYFQSVYPNAEQIITYGNYSSTNRFNCHGYAWYMSENEDTLSDPRWIGLFGDNPPDPEYTYWQDGSYMEILSSNTYPGKVNWSNGDHSAVTTPVQGELISKWGFYPLMKHQWNDSPYGSSGLKYYILNLSLSGPSILCSSGGSYSILNVPSGASITWSSSAGIARTSAQGSNPCNFMASITGTTGWVSATITYNGDTITLPHKTIWLGGVPSPELYANNATLTGSDWYTVVLNTPDVYFCLVPDPTGSPIYPDTWEVEGDSYWYTNGSFLEFVPNVLGENIVAGYRHNTCGFNGTYFTIEVVSSKSGEVVEDIYFKLSPNPANEYVDIKLALPDEEKMVDSYRVDFVDSYSRNVKQVVLSGLENRVNIQDLHPGYYVVLLRYNGEVYSNKLIVE